MTWHVKDRNFRFRRFLFECKEEGGENKNISVVDCSSTPSPTGFHWICAESRGPRAWDLGVMECGPRQMD